MGELRMSGKERVRLEALGRVKRKEMTVVAAAALLELSLRQMRRLWKRYRQHGDAGLVHKLRGRPSNRRLEEDLRQRIVKRHQEQYHDFGPTFACEKLAEEGLALSPNTLTALLKERGLWQRRRKRGKHRSRRERRASFGSLVQMDGSHHDWFEGRADKCVLMVLIDDATNRTYARFYPAETTEAAFDAFGRWVKRHGLPRAVYVDQHGIYRDKEHPEKPTQFGRAMKELGVELIQAHSPQAKGRVERRNAVFQDRLVKEMRLRNISDMHQANVLLESLFLDDLNRRYAVKAAKEQDLHRPLEKQVVLEEVLCVREERVVANDWCVRWHNRWLQIDSEHAALHLPGRKVRVKQLADGRLIAEHKGQRLKYRELGAKPQPVRQKKGIVNNRQWKPPASHPWKKGLAKKGLAKSEQAASEAVPRGCPAAAAPARDSHAGKSKTG
jgi:transposase